MDGSKKFIYNLRLLVDDLDSNDIISWNKDGDLICIHDKVKLTEILPRYFKSKNFNSFIRQLNLYGFRRIKLGKSLNNLIAFKHKHFIKDSPNELSNVRRQNELSNVRRQNELKDHVNIGTQTEKNYQNPSYEENDRLRINMLENEVDSLKAEVDELRASFSSVHVKLSNQQNLFYAAFRAMNSTQKQKDVFFNVFIKPNYQPKLTLNSEYKFQENYQSTSSVESSNRNEFLCIDDDRSQCDSRKGLLKLTCDKSKSKESNGQTIQQTYDVISSNLLNNPNYYNNFPIYVAPAQDEYMVDVDEQDRIRNESLNSVDTSYLMEILNNISDNHNNGTDLD